MSSQGFAALCGIDGIVLSVRGDGVATGVSLAAAVARDSRERLLQILTDARVDPQHSTLQMPDGDTLEMHCAGEGEHILVVAGETAADVRRLCEELFEDRTAGPLARRIALAGTPDVLTISLWQELARVNNDLVTSQRQLAKNNAELRWLNEQKNELLGMAAHDLRNPLAAVLAYSGFVLDDPLHLSEQQRSMLVRIRVNAEAMLGMVEDVLDFSAIESGKVRLDRTWLTLPELLDDIVDSNGLIAGRKKIRLVPSVNGNVPSVFADRRKLSQVLNNLVTNAIKFSHPDSTVTLAAEFDAVEGLRISVTDQGLGMTPDQIDRLFKPFARVGVQATAGEKSTGLGLAIARRIVEAHEGRIDVRSDEGEGSTFTVRIPGSFAAGRE